MQLQEIQQSETAVVKTWLLDLLLLHSYISKKLCICKKIIQLENECSTHPCLTLILCMHKHTYCTSFFIALPGVLHDTHTSSCVLEICLMMTHTPIPTFDCITQHIFLFHVYRSVSLACMWRYMQLGYLFHQCVTSFLSRDSCIADCTVRHLGVEHPFSN